MAKTKIDAENIRSRFGPKLPNGKNENPIFAMMDLVVGAMSAIGWGNPKRNYKDLNGLLNDKPHNIYHLINDIKESLNPTNTTEIKKNSLLSYTISNNDILKDIKTAINNDTTVSGNNTHDEILNEIKNSINNINLNLEKIVKSNTNESISEFMNKTENLIDGKIDFEIYLKDAKKTEGIDEILWRLNNAFNALKDLSENKDNIKNISELLETNGDLNNLVKNIQELFNSNSINESAKNFGEFIQGITSLLTIENLEDKIDDAIDNIEGLIKLIGPNKGNSIATLISNVNKIFVRKNPEDIIKRSQVLEKVLFNISLVSKNIPGVGRLILDNIKSSMLLGILHIYEEIIRKTNKINNQYDVRTLEGFNELLNNFRIIERTFKEIDLKVISGLTLEMINEVNLARKLFKKLHKLDEDSQEELTFESLNNTINNLHEIFNQMQVTYDEEISKLTAFSEFLNSFVLFSSIDLEKINEDNINELHRIIIGDKGDNGAFIKLMKDLKNDSDFGQTLRALLIIDENQLKNLENIIKIIDKLGKLSSIIIGAKITETGFEALEKAVDHLYNIFDNDRLRKINPDDIKKLEDSIELIAKVVIGSAAILLLGSFIMKFINIPDLMLFTFTLGAFVSSLVFVYKNVMKESNKALEGAEELMLITGASAMILLFGSYIMQYIEFADLLGFTVSLLGFVAGILFVYSYTSKWYKNALKSAEDFAILIAVSAGVLLLGSMFYHFIPAGDLIGFGLILLGFLAGICTIYAGLSRYIDKSFNGAKDFTYLIMVSAGLMLLGAFLYDFVIDNFESIFGFGFLLSLYVGLICAPWILGGKRMRKAMQGAKEFAYLVMVCAGVLILGPIIISLWANGNELEGYAKVFAFAVILGAFIIGLGFALKLAGKVKRLWPNALALMGLVVISAATLVAGPILLKEYNIEWYEILAFGVGLLLFTYFMGKAIQSFEKVEWGTILKGIVTMGAILLITYLSTLVIEEIRKAVGNNHGEYWLQLVEGVGGIFLVIGAIGAGAIGIGMLLTGGTLGIGAGMLAVGIIAILGIAFAAYVSIKVVSEIHRQMQSIGDIEKIKDEVDDLIEVIVHAGKQMIGAFGVKDIIKLYAATGRFKDIGIALSYIAKGVQDWAMLKIPEGFDKNGKPTGYFTINEMTLSTMSQNIELVLTALGRAIMDTIKRNPEYFEKPMLGLGKSKFEVAIKGFKMMGDMLSNIAQGVQDWAMLKIPTDFDGKTGKPKRYIRFNDKTRWAMAQNIRYVLEAIGNAVINVVKGNKELFGTEFWSGKSKFEIAIRGFAKSGEMLSNVAKGIQAWAMMSIPTKFDENGKPTDFTPITNTDLTKMGDNIETILVAVGTAICDTVYNHPECFDDGDDSPALIAAQSISATAQGINSIIDIIKKLSEKDFKTIIDNINSKDPNNPGVIKSMEDIIDGLFNIINIFIRPSEVKTVWQALFGSNSTVAEVLNNNIGEITKSKDSINKFTTALISILESVRKLTNDQNTKITTLKDINSEDFQNNIINTLEGTIKFSSKIKDLNWRQLQYFNNGQYDKKVVLFTTSLKSIFNSIIQLINHYYKQKQFIIKFGKGLYDNQIINSITHFITIAEKINKLNFRELNKLSENKKKFEFLQPFTQLIDNFISSIIKYDEDQNTHLNLLLDGMVKLYTTTAEWGPNNVFTQYVQDVKDFVQSINDLNIDKLSTMNNLISAMSELATKLGNVDGLIDALANKLAPIIAELVTQLQKAEATIKNAHELQRVRKDLIDSSVKKIKELMDQHMVVEVLRGDDSENTPTISSGGGNNYQGGSNNTPTSNDAEPPLESPEDAGQQQATGSAEKVKEYNPFYMGENIAETAAKKVVNAIFKKWGG